MPSLNPENLPETKQTSKHEELHNTNRTIFPRGCAASTEARGTALKPELDPHELPQLAWQQPSSSAIAWHEQEALRRPSAEQASQQQTGRSKTKQQGTPEELEGTASPSHSLLLKLEASKSASDSGASLSVLRVGQQVSSASSFQTSMEQLVAEQLLAQSVALADDLEYSLPTRACQDSSSQQTFQDLASRACRDTSVHTEPQESNLVDLRQSAGTSLQSAFASSTRSSTDNRHRSASWSLFTLVLESLRAIRLCTFAWVFETLTASLQSTSFISSSRRRRRARTSRRRRPPTQLSIFLALLLTAGAAWTVQGQTFPGNFSAWTVLGHLASGTVASPSLAAHSMQETPCIAALSLKHCPSSFDMITTDDIFSDKLQKETVDNMEFQQTFRELAEYLAHLRKIRQKQQLRDKDRQLQNY